MKHPSRELRTLLLTAALSLTVGVGCRPPPVPQPNVGARPVTVVPPAPEKNHLAEQAEVEVDLDDPDHVRALLRETDEPIRIRVFARPLEGDAVTEQLVGAARDILQLAEVPTRFDLDDPVATPAAATEARILGVEPLGTRPGDRRRRDPLPEDADYRAMVVAVGEDYLTVAQVTPDRGDLQFQVAEAISRLMHGPRLVGLVTSGDRGTKLGHMIESLDRMDVRPVTLDSPVAEDYSALLIVGPGGRLTQAEVARLEAFIDRGRAVGMLLDGMEVEPAHKRYRVRHRRSGLEGMLEDWGLEIERDLVFDNQCGRVSVPARVGRMLMHYPPIPALDVEVDEVSPDADDVRLPFPSSMTVEPPEGVEIEPMLRSSPESWLVRGGGWNLSPFQRWTMGEPRGPFVLGAIVRRAGGGRLAVVSNARFVEDRYLGVADNAQFLRQLVEWLSGHRALTRLIARSSSVQRPGNR